MPTVLLPVPHHRQIGPHNCLPACARMVLLYLGEDISEAELAFRLGTTEVGTPGRRLLRLAGPALPYCLPPADLVTRPHLSRRGYTSRCPGAHRVPRLLDC